MRFNFILSTILALVSVVSASLNVVSPSSSSVWKFGLKEVVNLQVYDLTYSHVDLVLVCLHGKTTEDLYTLKEGFEFTSSSEFDVKIPRVSKKCDKFFIKVLAHDLCDRISVFFSAGFSITVDGKLEHLPECVPGKLPDQTPVPEVKPEPTSKPEDKPKTKEEKPQPSNPPHDETPTKTQVDVLPTSPKDQETTTPNRSVPLPSTGKTESLQTPSSTSSQSTAESAKPTKKPDDVDNSGSMLTFKLFGTLFAVLVVFLYC